MANDLSGLRIAKEAKGGDASSPSSRPPKKTGWMVWSVIGVVLVGGGGWWLGRPRLPEVEAATVSIQQDAKSMPILSASGYITPHQQVVVGAKMTGRVVKIYVDEGDVVEENGLLAELEASELKAGVSRAQAEFDESERQWRRYQNMWRDKIIAKAELDRVETAFKVAQAALELTKAQLENMMIRAPFKGTILKKHIELGQMLTPGASQDGGIAAFTMADLDHLDVNVDVSEGNIQKITIDHPTEVVAEAYADEMFPGRVVKIAPSANRQKAIVEVQVRILKADRRLKPDMSVKVTFVEKERPRSIGREKPRVLVPKAAVLQEGPTAYVWMLEAVGKSLTAKKTAIETRKEWTQYWEVGKGLAGGEQVVVAGMEGLQEGQKVKIKEK